MSPRLENLQAAIAKDSRAIDAFWNEVRVAGTPLVERIEGTDDVLVTFLLRSGTELENAIVFATVLPDNDPARQRLNRLPGTDVWFRSYRFRRDMPILYELSVDGPQKLRRDPLNPRFIEGPMGGSIAMLPGIPSPPKSDHSAAKIDTTRFHSELLRNDRKIATYLPAGFQPSGEYNLLIVLDEDVFNGPVGLPSILDNLIASRRLRPTVAAMIGNTERERELSCDPAFSKMLSQELLPWIERRYKLHRRRQTTIAGSSLGGLAAACAAFQASKAFPNVVALSGSFRWRPVGDAEPEWLTRQIATSPQVPVRFFIGVGSFETGTPREPANPSLLTAARHLRDVLRAKGYRLTYREFPGAHEPLSWSLTIGDALVAVQ